MKFVLVALCALLGCARSQDCEWDERVHSFPGGLALVSPLVPAEDSDLDACRARCCGNEHCDTVVLQGDAHGLCYVLHCGDSCVYEDDTSNEYRVFTRSDEHAPANSVHVEPMLLGPSTRVEDQENNNNSSSDVCTLPRVVGNCKAAFPRFFFDAESGSCQGFIYGGCGANANNFETEQECEDRCGGGTDGESLSGGKTLRLAALPQDGPSEEEPEEEPEENPEESTEAPQAKEMSEDDFQEQCAAPPAVGPCRAALPRWFYNKSSGRCERFIYGGCRGNKNNHDSEEHCSSTCSGVKLLPSKKQVPALTDEEYKARCTAAPDSGPCRAAFPMFYFDPETQSCKTFFYGGCRGNDNRYDSESECVERCTHPGASEGRGQARNRWTAAFFLFLTLAAVSFLLLTTLIFITMRRNRTPRRALSIRSDKEGLLPDSERSSVDSLPLPESPTTG